MTEYAFELIDTRLDMQTVSKSHDYVMIALAVRRERRNGDDSSPYIIHSNLVA